MPVSRRMLMCSRALAVFVFVAILCSAMVAQDQAKPAQATVKTQNSVPSGPTPQINVLKSPSILKVWKPYVGRSVPKANFGNGPRIDSLVSNGKLMLSLNDAIALALENNYDIAIARYNLPIADTDILRTEAGGGVRGVNTGVLSGTPGGTAASTAGAQGGGAGGTSSGAGGAATGAGGVVSSTAGVGSAIDSYDPVLTGTLQLEQSATPQSNTVFSGVSSLTQNVGTANFGFQQGWATGSLLSVSFDNTRTTTNSTRTSLVPALNSSFRATLRQHLLQGFGWANNRREIVIAKNDRRISDVAFKQQVISTVAQIQNIYWDLVNAYEDLKVKETALEFAQRTLGDNKKQVQIGTLAPIEVVSAQSAVASAEQALIVSQTNLQYQQLLMKNAISRNMSDPTIASAPVIPTDTMSVVDEKIPSVNDLVKEALANRPELQQSEITLTNNAITKKAARNALLPTLDLIGFYGASGLAGNFNQAAICPPGSTSLLCVPADQVPPNTGYGDAFSNLFNSSAPDKGIALQLTIPLRNRAARADQIRSELEYRQSELLLQQQKNQIMLQVRNAAFALQQNRAAVAAAKAARDYAQQSLEAEQKKYALGASTSYLVLQAQSNATQAASNYVAALSAYEKSRVALDQVTATTLARNGILMNDAISGNVTHEPDVPNLTPRTNLTPPPMTAPQTSQVTATQQ